ncbi:hypothetical protein DXT89_15495 [Agrobacterium vitis]|uniref:Uncharacterized protein n=1 Tax=Agrobacterium vitis TaxID=373 RepID=A0A368NHX6_AGRVI|nr:hypothetical protein DXM22_15075 [Agrobacterium vitis]KAA3525952.1 hypothetical protein DXT89_15495 [Agrobacterium vitis]RCU48991.1 hypothetical protein ASB66_024525 [Agrobacterium vitis]
MELLFISRSLEEERKAASTLPLSLGPMANSHSSGTIAKIALILDREIRFLNLFKCEPLIKHASLLD